MRPGNRLLRPQMDRQVLCVETTNRLCDCPNCGRDDSGALTERSCINLCIAGVRSLGGLSDSRLAQRFKWDVEGQLAGRIDPVSFVLNREDQLDCLGIVAPESKWFKNRGHQAYPSVTCVGSLSTAQLFSDSGVN